MKQSNSNKEDQVTMIRDKEDLVIKKGEFTKDSSFNLIKELTYLLAIFIITIILFKIIFNKESLYIIFRVILSFFFLFILPGYAILLYWKNSLDFLERFIISFPLGAAITGSFGFLLGLINIKMGIHMWIIPITCFILGWFFVRKK